MIESCPSLESRLPRRCLESLRAYAENHRPTGSFLRAVLENDLFRAVASADDVNLGLLAEYACYVHDALPSACHGSREKVAMWLGYCEHGVVEGDWCEPCNREYKVAALEAETVE